MGTVSANSMNIMTLNSGRRVESTVFFASEVSMSFHMQRQMVTSRKLSFAQMALEGFGPGVFAVMPGQFVRPRKLPTAAFPRTLVWLFSRVRSFVSFQVRTLGVNLIAVGEVTGMNFSSLETFFVIGSGLTAVAAERVGRRRRRGTGRGVVDHSGCHGRGLRHRGGKVQTLSLCACIA